MSVEQSNQAEGTGAHVAPSPPWRVMLVEVGDEPRQVLSVNPCQSYFAAVKLLRAMLNVRSLSNSRYTAPISHTRDHTDWLPAEAVAVSAYSPAPMSRIVQVEYLRGADAPADLFTVPKPHGLCWRCQDPLEAGRGYYCPKCRRDRRRIYQNWWRHHTSQEEPECQS